MRPNNKPHMGPHCKEGSTAPEPVKNIKPLSDIEQRFVYRPARCLSTKTPFSLQAGPDFA